MAQPEPEDAFAGGELGPLPGDFIPPVHPGDEDDYTMPAELLALSGQQLQELYEAAPAFPVPAAPVVPEWPLSYGAAACESQDESWGGFGQDGSLDDLPAGIQLAEFADAAHRARGVVADDPLIGVIRAWRRVTSWAQARELAAIAELARRRPAPGYPPGPSGGLPAKLSEFIGAELAPALTLTGRAAEAQLGLALALAHRPATAAALEAGRIDLAKARLILEFTALLAEGEAAGVEAAVLPGAGEQTTGQLRAALLRAVLAADPDAARRRRQEAEKHAAVEYWADPDGTATLAGRCLPPAPVLAADQRLSAIAKSWKKQGAQGGMDRLRAAAYLALLLGQDSTTVPDSLLLSATDSLAPGTAAHSGAAHGGPSPGGEAPTGTAHGGPAPGDTAGNGTAHGGPAPSGAANGDLAPESQRGAGVGMQPVPAGLTRPGPVELPPLTGSVHLTIPYRTLLGLADSPGEAAGYGPLHADTCRELADALARHRATQWGIIITNQHGHAVAWAGPARARPAKGPPKEPGQARGSPASVGGWTITLTTEPIAPYR